MAGAGGLVGASLVSHCTALGDESLAYTRQNLDITDAKLVDRVIADQKPNIVINCAAWTDVDGCESDHERAFLVNAQGPQNLAAACRKVGAAFVTISTDYVFDGTKQGFYTQRDDPNPQSVYGVSKLEGEQRARSVYSQTIVARTGFVFGQGGKNFLSTVVERARQGKRLQVISDAHGTPTYAPDLSARLRELAMIGTPDVFHVVNAGTGASYEDFARLALRTAGLSDSNLQPISMATLNRPAPRPANSRLWCLVSESMGLAPMPVWQDALRRFVAQPGKAEKVSPVRF